METNSTNTNPNNIEDKTVAILSYLTIIGYIIAIVLHGNKKTELGSYHLRQATGIIISAFAVWLAVFFLGMIPLINLTVFILAPLSWLAIMVLVILGVLNASNGDKKPLPFIGKFFEKNLVNAFN